MLEDKINGIKNNNKLTRVTPAKYKNEHIFLKDVDSYALKYVQLRLEQAFRNHFRNPKHFKHPKFKKTGVKKSYTTYNDKGIIKINFEKSLLYLPKIRDGIKIKLHRGFAGKIKSVTIKKTKTEKYYASILVEVENNMPAPEPISNVAGIDLGIKFFATVTDDKGSYKIEHPGYLIRAEKKLKRIQKKLSKKKPNSKNYKKLKIILAKQYEYLTNARKDFLHKLSKKIVNENKVIVVEDLNVKGLMKSFFVSKRVFDSNWGMFLRFLEYKAKMYGRDFIVVDRYYPSSKTCSECGFIYSSMNLAVREWACPACGTHHDRDINASKNLYKRGFAHLTSGRDGAARTQACGECSAGGMAQKRQPTRHHLRKQEAEVKSLCSTPNVGVGVTRSCPQVKEEAKKEIVQNMKNIKKNKTPPT